MPKHFGMFDEVDGMKPCQKTTIVHAVQINEPFTVKSLEGVVSGDAGDYLMKGVQGELYICEKSIFEKSYAFVDRA